MKEWSGIKRFKFYYNPQIPTVDPDEEIIEFDDDATMEEVQEAFTEWVFNKLDTAIIPLSESEKPSCKDCKHRLKNSNSSEWCPGIQGVVECRLQNN